MYIVSHRRKRSEGYRFHVQFLEKISPNVGRPRKFISPSPLCPSFIEILRQRTIERKKIHPIRNSRRGIETSDPVCRPIFRLFLPLEPTYHGKYAASAKPLD